MSARGQVVLGEVVGGDGPLTDLPCGTPGVRARSRTMRSGRVVVEQRLYECPNGFSLACRRGGPLHLADEESWEVTTMRGRVAVIGRPVGWVPDRAIERLVARLATWPPEDAAISTRLEAAVTS